MRFLGRPASPGRILEKTIKTTARSPIQVSSIPPNYFARMREGVDTKMRTDKLRLQQVGEGAGRLNS